MMMDSFLWFAPPQPVPRERYDYLNSMTDEEIKNLIGPRTVQEEEFYCLVGGIPEKCSNPGSYIGPLFDKYNVPMVMTPGPSRNKKHDICFVNFHDRETMEKAILELNGMMYRGNALVVREAPQADYKNLAREILESHGIGHRYFDLYLDDLDDSDEDSDDETRKKMRVENEGKDELDDVEDHEKSEGTDGKPNPMMGTGLHSAAARVGTPAAVEVQVQEAAEENNAEKAVLSPSQPLHRKTFWE